MALSGLPLILTFGVAVLLGGVVAWLLLGARARQTAAVDAERLSTREQRIEALEREGRERSAELTILREKLQSEAERRSAAEAKALNVDRLEAQLAERGQELSRSAQERSDHIAKIAHLETRLADESRARQEQLKVLDGARESLTESFRSLSSKALAESNRSFLDLAKQTLEKYQSEARSDLQGRQQAVEHLVVPIRESLGKVDQQLRVLEVARQEAYGGLREQIEGLSRAQSGLQSETRRLSVALRAPNVRGQWGEIHLRRVVEISGMLPHVDFQEQKSLSGDEGATLRPDLIVQLPGDKVVVVDAKAPLKGYLDAIEASDEAVRKERMQLHARQLRSHMEKLAAKGYAEQLDTTPEFVVLFLPSESFFSAALEQDPSLIEDGVRRGVILATPTTLIALLRAVSYGWRQDRLAEGAQAISQLGRELYDRLRTMSEHTEKVGRRLRGAVESYNQMVGSFQSRVLVSARRFEELGVPSGKEIPTLGPVDITPREVAGWVEGGTDSLVPTEAPTLDEDEDGRDPGDTSDA